MAKKETYPWVFPPRFRRSAFGWRSDVPIKRIHEAVAEIKNVAKTDPITASDGAVIFLEKVAPALEHVDRSSGAIGATVNKAIEDLVPIIAKAPADDKTRDKWLERLWEAVQEDKIPCIGHLTEFWGELCVTAARAAKWADELDNYGTDANLAIFRAVMKKYPHKAPLDVLNDLVNDSPGEEGKWFAAARSAGFFERAIELATTSPCNPRTLLGAADDMIEKSPGFALASAQAALYWMCRGYGCSLSAIDVNKACDCVLKAADRAGLRKEMLTWVKELSMTPGCDQSIAADILSSRPELRETQERSHQPHRG